MTKSYNGLPANGLIFWNYKDSTGYLYPPETYSGNVWLSLYDYSNINFEENTITLKSTWNKGTIKAGTKVSQSLDAATYNYQIFQNETFDLIISIVTVLIFIGFTAYDIQRIKEMSFTGLNEDVIAIYGALQLYLDFINIFLHLLELMGNNDN